MEVAEAAQKVGEALRNFVTAKPHWERLETGQTFHDLKTAFRKTYGEAKWRETFEWSVKEWDLEDFIFDNEALRDV